MYSGLILKKEYSLNLKGQTRINRVANVKVNQTAFEILFFYLLEFIRLKWKKHKSPDTSYYPGFYNKLLLLLVGKQGKVAHHIIHSFFHRFQYAFAINIGDNLINHFNNRFHVFSL